MRIDEEKTALSKLAFMLNEDCKNAIVWPPPPPERENRMISHADEDVVDALYAEIARQNSKLDALIEALQEIEQWATAYPLEMFPKPDLAKAHELLQGGGMTLDGISAEITRHVIERAGTIARRALLP
jgi:hypothetical protein